MMVSLRVVRIAPADFLGAARTISTRDVQTCDLLTEWLSEATYLSWAQRGLDCRDAYGLSNAISYSKLAVACRIDRLLWHHHLSSCHRAKFPQKLEVLRCIGVKIPGVVQRLVIEPRNEIEHAYRAPEEGEARNAVEIAEMCVAATEEEAERSPIVALGWNVNGSHVMGDFGRSVTFHGFRDGVMAFIDVFQTPAAAKIVDPQAGEVRVAGLADFTRQEAEDLAQILRSHYSHGSRSASGADHGYYREMKRQGGF
jgi:hypothetical protein